MTCVGSGDDGEKGEGVCILSCCFTDRDNVCSKNIYDFEIDGRPEN